MQIPERLVNFNVYGGPAATLFLGMATVDLPSFEPMKETISGAGIAGEYEAPVLGHFTSQMVKLQWRTITQDVFLLLAPVMQVLDIRGSIEVLDPMLGVTNTVAVRVECRGQTKSSNLGKLEPGKVMGSELDLECAVVRVSIEGAPVVEIDKFNMVYRVGPVDYLAKVRRDVGGV